MNRYTSSLILLCLLLSPGRLPGEGEDGETQGLGLTCLYWEGLPTEELYYREGESFHLLKFSEAIRSGDFRMKGMSVFELYREAVEPEEGEPPYDLLAKTTLPAAKQILILVIPFGQEDGIHYRVLAMDDSLNAFPPGTFRFVNFSPDTLFVKCGETSRKLPPKEITVIGAGGAAGGFVPFIIGDASGKPIFGTRIFGQPSGRELIFISPPAKAGGMPRVKFISQLIALPEPEPAP